MVNFYRESFKFRLKAKKMLTSRVDNHAWTGMNEEEILRSSGLILTDPDTGREGITLATTCPMDMVSCN